MPKVVRLGHLGANAAVMDSDNWNFYQMLMSWTTAFYKNSNCRCPLQQYLIKIIIVVAHDSGIYHLLILRGSNILL